MPETFRLISRSFSEQTRPTQTTLCNGMSMPLLYLNGLCEESRTWKANHRNFIVYCNDSRLLQSFRSMQQARLYPPCRCLRNASDVCLRHKVLSFAYAMTVFWILRQIPLLAWYPRSGGLQEMRLKALAPSFSDTLHTVEKHWKTVNWFRSIYI